MRKYEKIKLWFNKSEHPDIDDEYLESIEARKVIISYYEDKLHVCFSRRMLVTVTSLVFGLFAIVFTILGLKVFPIILGSLSLLNLIIRLYYANKYRILTISYKISISLLDTEIKKTHNLTLPNPFINPY